MLTNKIGCVSHKHGAKHTSYVMCAWIFHLSSHSYLNLSHLIKSKKGIVIPLARKPYEHPRGGQPAARSLALLLHPRGERVCSLEATVCPAYPPTYLELASLLIPGSLPPSNRVQSGPPVKKCASWNRIIPQSQSGPQSEEKYLNSSSVDLNSLEGAGRFL